MDTYLADADRIFNDFKTRLSTDETFRSLDSDKQLDYYQKNNHEFSMTFPLTLRYMIQLKQYNKKAFAKFIKKLQSNPYRSELEYCERQADYVKYLYMETSSDHNMKNAQQVWKNTYDMLAAEVKMFKDAEEKIKKKLEINNEKNEEERRDELKKALGF